jgi:protein-disulfide isomerase
VRRLAAAGLLLMLVVTAAAAAQFGPAQYAIHADDGDPITNYDLGADLSGRLAKLPGTVAAGNLQGDVTLVQFYDLNCPFCREAAADVDALVRADNKLKLVFVPYAVLSMQSVQGALIEVAAAKLLTPEKYLEFHRRIYAGRGVIDGARAMQAAKEMGLDQAKVAKIAGAEATLGMLKQNADFGSAASMVATPAYVIKGVAILGHPGLKPLQKVIAAVRRCGAVVC